MPNLTAPEISRMLREIGDRMVLEGGNTYRARAYNRAAENLALSTIPLNRRIKEERLTEIPGIGDALAAVITKLHDTGSHASLEAKRAEIPRAQRDEPRAIRGASPATQRVTGRARPKRARRKSG